jgi:glutaredoxin 3
MKIEIYSKDFCGFCDAAKNLMEIKGLEYTEYRIGYENITRETLLERVPSARTVPQIIIDGNIIGGFDDFKEWLSSS